MQIHTSDQAARAAGQHISQLIAEHAGDMVCLLSGGSALDIIEHIKVEEKSECRTIFMLGDERGSRDPQINNSLQLVDRYPGHPVTQRLIMTVPEPDENLENFTSRISEKFFTEISRLQNPKIIHVLGVGPDGHTAGIFPMDEVAFAATYNQPDPSIVPVHLEGLRIDSRASFTPIWILESVDTVVAYVAGESKLAILESIKNESKKLHERPAELLKLHKNVHLYTDLQI